MSKDFNNIIDESIGHLINDMKNKTDVIIMQDLKRMSELGVLEVQQTQPEYILPSINESLKVNASFHVRLRFKGEETIVSQQKEIDQLKEENTKVIERARELNRLDKGIIELVEEENERLKDELKKIYFNAYNDLSNFS